MKTRKNVPKKKAPKRKAAAKKKTKPVTTGTGAKNKGLKENPEIEYPREVGRPSKKDNADYEMIFRLMQRGLTDAELAEVFAVDESTINRWKKDPEFCKAIKQGKKIANFKVVASLFNKATGFDHEEITREVGDDGKLRITKVVSKYHPASDQSIRLFLINRMPDQFRDKQDVAVAGDLTIIAQKWRPEK